MGDEKKGDIGLSNFIGFKELQKKLTGAARDFFRGIGSTGDGATDDFNHRRTSKPFATSVERVLITTMTSTLKRMRKRQVTSKPTLR